MKERRRTSIRYPAPPLRRAGWFLKWVKVGQTGGLGLRGGAPPCWWCVHSILLLLLSPQKWQLICGHFVAFVRNLPQLCMWAVVWGVICLGTRASTPIGGPRPQPTSNVTVSLIEELNLTGPPECSWKWLFSWSSFEPTVVLEAEASGKPESLTHNNFGKKSAWCLKSLNIRVSCSKTIDN